MTVAKFPKLDVVMAVGPNEPATVAVLAMVVIWSIKFKEES